jgi:hypothetical protein
MIEKLTTQQESEIKTYFDKWLAIGYRTQTQDAEKAKEFVAFLYKNFLDLPTPEIHFVKSPMEGQLLINKLVNNIDKDSNQTFEYFEPARENWWMSYFSKYDYILNVLFPEKKPEFELFREFLNYSENCHTMWTFDQFAVVCDFPNGIETVPDVGIQSFFTPAISYRDGYGIYGLNGESMDKAEWEKETIKYKSSLATEIFKKV